VWRTSGGSHLDSTFNVTAYDWLLASGQSIASGKKVMIIQHRQSKRWYVIAAECAT